jgi:hypothetical protein
MKKKNSSLQKYEGRKKRKELELTTAEGSRSSMKSH